MTKTYCDRAGCLTREEEVAMVLIPVGIGATTKADYCLPCRTKILRFFNEFNRGTRDVA